MDIRFISSLTAEDEDVFAPAVLKAVSVLLDTLPIAYTLRIETARAQVYQHTHAAAEPVTTGDAQIGSGQDSSVATPFGPASQVDGTFLKYFARD